MTSILAIDPSTKALGYARFVQYEYDWELDSSGCLHRHRKLDWIQGIDRMVLEVVAMQNEDDNDHVVIEQPGVFGGRAGIAGSNTGSIQKLMGCVFALRQALMDRGVDVCLVRVQDWKGTVKKSITQRRMRKHWGWTGVNHNEADAVGIGDWWIRSGPGRSLTKR